MGSVFSQSYPYGDIREVETTGASKETARADGKSCIGEAASHKMAADDLPYIENYRVKIIDAANEYKVQPSVVAAIISRETRGGRGAGFSKGWGDHGKAFGLMQIDKEWHKPWINPKTDAPYEWDSQKHLEQGIEILVDLYGIIGRIDRFSHWTENQKLKGALAAYNMGTKEMDPNNVDAHTTGKDYSNDVTARAQYYEKHLF